MPTYEYRCTACGHTFELFQPITAQALTRCPQCAGTLERLLGTGAAVIFKGSGFYVTDYRSPDYRKKAKEESGAGSAASPPAKGDSAKSDTKSAGTSAKEPSKE